MKKKIRKTKKNIWMRCILINVASIVVMLILFTPFLPTDDYYMSQILYGTCGDTYDYHLTFMNFWYGRLLVALMNIMPKIPWYTVCFYLWVFISLMMFTYLILSSFDDYIGELVAILIIMYFSYEGYIATQFTKVAGIIGTVGMLSLMWPRKKLWCRILGGLLLLLSCMIRYEEAKMVVGATAFVMICCYALSLIKEKKMFSNVLQLGSVVGFFVGALIFVAVPKVPTIFSAEEQKFWSLFWQYNEIRSAMQDYGIPEYQDNKEIYDSLGISENDLYLTRSWNFDIETFSLDKGQIILDLCKGKEIEVGRDENGFVNLASQKEKKALKQGILGNITNSPYLNKENILSFLRLVPRQFLNIDLFWLYALIMLIMVVSLECSLHRKITASGISILLFLALNYYMYVHGRYLQHRVDVGVLCVVIGMYLYLLDGIKSKNFCGKANVMWITLASCCLCMMLSGKYFSWEDENCIDSNTLSDNKIFFEEAQKGSLTYVGCGSVNGDIGLYKYYDSLYVPQTGSSRRVIRPHTRVQLEAGECVVRRVVNDLQYYLMLADNDTNEPAWTTYYSEHTNQSADLHLVKKYLKKKIYRVTTTDLTELIQPDQWYDDSGIDHSMSHTVVDGQLQVEGTAYLSGESGFAQNSYIEIVDSKTNQKSMYFALQTCNNNKEYGDDGYFAWITADVELPEYYDDTDAINLIVEQDGLYHRLQLN